VFSIRVVYYTQSTLDTNSYVSVPDTFYAKSSIRTPDDFNAFPDFFSVIYPQLLGTRYSVAPGGLIAEFYLLGRGLRHRLPGFSSLGRLGVLP